LDDILRDCVCLLPACGPRSSGRNGGRCRGEYPGCRAEQEERRNEAHRSTLSSRTPTPTRCALNLRRMTGPKLEFQACPAAWPMRAPRRGAAAGETRTGYWLEVRDSKGELLTNGTDQRSPCGRDIRIPSATRPEKFPYAVIRRDDGGGEFEAARPRTVRVHRRFRRMDRRPRYRGRRCRGPQRPRSASTTSIDSITSPVGRTPARGERDGRSQTATSSRPHKIRRDHGRKFAALQPSFILGRRLTVLPNSRSMRTDVHKKFYHHIRANRPL